PALSRTDCKHQRSRTDDPCFRNLSSRIGAKIGLIQNQHGPRTAFVREREISLQAARVVVEVEAANDEKDVNVRGQDLFAKLGTRLFSRQLGPPGQHAHYRRRLSNKHPVSNTWPIIANTVEPSARRQREFACLCPQSEKSTPDKSDAAGKKRRVGALVREKVIPADLLQIHGHPLSADCL